MYAGCSLGRLGSCCHLGTSKLGYTLNNSLCIANTRVALAGNICRMFLASSGSSRPVSAPSVLSDETLLAIAAGHERFGPKHAALTLPEVTRALELTTEMQTLPGTQPPDAGRILSLLRKTLSACDTSSLAACASLHTLVCTMLRPEVRTWIDRTHRSSRRHTMIVHVGAALQAVLHADGWPPLAASDILQSWGMEGLLSPVTVEAAAAYLTRNAAEMEIGDLARMLSGISAVSLQGSMASFQAACGASTSRLHSSLLTWRSPQQQQGATGQELDRRLRDLELLAAAFVAVGRLEARTLDTLALHVPELMQALSTVHDSEENSSLSLNELDKSAHHALVSRKRFSSFVQLCRHIVLLSGPEPAPSVHALIALLRVAVRTKISTSVQGQQVTSADAVALLAMQSYGHYGLCSLDARVGVLPPAQQRDGRWTLDVRTPREEEGGEAELVNGEARTRNARKPYYSCIVQMPISPMANARQLLASAVRVAERASGSFSSSGSGDGGHSGGTFTCSPLVTEHGVRLDAFSAFFEVEGAGKSSYGISNGSRGRRSGSHVRMSRVGIIVTRRMDYLPQEVPQVQEARYGPAPVPQPVPLQPGLALSRSLTLARTTGWGIVCVLESDLWEGQHGAPSPAAEHIGREMRRLGLVGSTAAVPTVSGSRQEPHKAGEGEGRGAVAIERALNGKGTVAMAKRGVPEEQDTPTIVPHVQAPLTRPTEALNSIAAPQKVQTDALPENPNDLTGRLGLRVTPKEVHDLFSTEAGTAPLPAGGALGPFGRLLASLHDSLVVGKEDKGKHILRPTVRSVPVRGGMQSKNLKVGEVVK